jgi:hypothetical protein
MRKIILVTGTIAAMCSTGGVAHAEGSWCAYDVRGGTNCGFHSYAQCMANISGIGGSCSPNPSLPPRSSRRPRDW